MSSKDLWSGEEEEDLLAPEYFTHPDNQGVTRRLRNAGEVAQFGKAADAVRGQLESLGYDVEVWTPSRLAHHYLKSEWRGRNDKYVVTATRATEHSVRDPGIRLCKKKGL